MQYRKQLTDPDKQALEIPLTLKTLHKQELEIPLTLDNFTQANTRNTINTWKPYTGKH